MLLQRGHGHNGCAQSAREHGRGVQGSLGQAGCRHIFSKQKIPDLNFGGGVQINSVGTQEIPHAEREDQVQNQKKVFRM